MLEGDSLLRELGRAAALGALFCIVVGFATCAALALRRVRYASAHPLRYPTRPALVSPVRPTEPGWYWVTRHGADPEVVFVEQRGDERVVLRCRGEPTLHADPVTSPYFDGAHWAGPLEPPPALLAHRRRRPLEGPRPE